MGAWDGFCFGLGLFVSAHVVAFAVAWLARWLA